MKIDNVDHRASGVGGSYSRWQGKPPAHIEVGVEFKDGDKYVGDFHYRTRDDELDFAGVIDQVTSDYKFKRLPKDVQEKIKEKAKDIAYDSGFFDVSKSKDNKQKLKSEARDDE